MWAKLDARKNRFLQGELPLFSATDIKTKVDNKFIKCIELIEKKCPRKSKSCEKHPSFRDDRAALAFGVRGLPKLIKEICSDTEIVQWRAINTLKEVLKDPLEANRSVIKYDVIRKLQNLLLRTRRRDLIRGAKLILVILKILRCLAIYEVAGREIGRRHNLLNELYDMISVNDQSDLCSQILMRTTAHPTVILHFLKCTDAFHRLTGVIQCQCSNELPKNLWIHCSHFIEIIPVLAVQLGYYEMLQEKILNIDREDHMDIILKCFALLLECVDGQEKLDKYDGISLIYNLMTSDRVDLYEPVVLALQNATHNRRALMRCCAFWDLPLILVGYAQDKHNYRLQLYCLQTLRQITQMPVIKGFVRKVCRDEIVRIQTLCDHVKHSKIMLLKWIDKKVYDTGSSSMCIRKSNSYNCPKKN